MPDYLDLYGGKIKANRVASFTRGGVNFDIIRPGYDAQGRRRQAWTQFVYKGVPVYEVKLRATTPIALKKFDEMWGKYIEGAESVLLKALDATVKERTSKFQDGLTGETPADALSVDGRKGAKTYDS